MSFTIQRRRCAALSMLFVTLAACDRAAAPPANARPASRSPVAAEADEIRQLLAYAIVAAQWDTDGGARRRGHNIGAVLARPDGLPVSWALNATFAEDSPLEHAEARVLRR